MEIEHTSASLMQCDMLNCEHFYWLSKLDGYCPWYDCESAIENVYISGVPAGQVGRGHVPLYQIIKKKEKAKMNEHLCEK